MASTKDLPQGRRETIQPPCSIHEEDHKVILVMEMPGVQKGDVQISVEDDELRVAAKRVAPARQGSYLIHERRTADYFASYTLDDTIDRDRIEAETSHGVLTITMELKESSKPRQITVREVT